MAILLDIQFIYPMENPYTDVKANPGKHNFQDGSLLVVEDNVDHWKLIQRGLQQVLPEVNLLWAATPAEAMEYLETCVNQKHELPRLLLLDLYLPDREDGFQLLKSIKTAGPALKRVPIVVLSNSHHVDDITEVYELGGSSYFVKPTQPSEWQTYFRAIFDYWGLTATLPTMRPR